MSKSSRSLAGLWRLFDGVTRSEEADEGDHGSWGTFGGDDAGAVVVIVFHGSAKYNQQNSKY